MNRLVNRIIFRTVSEFSKFHCLEISKAIILYTYSKQINIFAKIKPGGTWPYIYNKIRNYIK